MATKLDDGRLVEVIDLFRHVDDARTTRVPCFTLVVVFAISCVAFVVDHDQQRDQQWTHHTRQYLTTLQTALY